MDDRFLAYKILLKIERDKAYSNITIDSVLKSNEVVSAPFVCQIVYGVMYFLLQGDRNKEIPEIAPRFARRKVLTRGPSGS